MNFFSIKGLTLRIEKRMICNQLTLNFSPGECWGILGPNGSGKTTILHTLAGIRRKNEGELLLKGKKFSHFSNRQLAQMIGLLFQMFEVHFSQRVWDYCLASRYPYLAERKNQHEEIVWHALKTLELESLVYRRIDQLSGGEKRRLAIAALLSQTPEIYLLDEPTNHLDIYYQIKTLNHFQFLAKEKNKLVIMSLHDMNLAERYCTHVLLLFPDGKTLEGKTAKLLTTQNLSKLYHFPIQKVNGFGTARM